MISYIWGGTYMDLWLEFGALTQDLAQQLNLLPCGHAILAKLPCTELKSVILADCKSAQEQSVIETAEENGPNLENRDWRDINSSSTDLVLWKKPCWTVHFGDTFSGPKQLNGWKLIGKPSYSEKYTHSHVILFFTKYNNNTTYKLYVGGICHVYHVVNTIITPGFN